MLKFTQPLSGGVESKYRLSAPTVLLAEPSGHVPGKIAVPLGTQSAGSPLVILSFFILFILSWSFEVSEAMEVNRVEKEERTSKINGQQSVDSKT